MKKPHAKSTLKEMKDYIRAKKLNKPEIKLGMKKAEMVAALKKMGHWDPKHDGASAPKKKAPKKPAPKKPTGGGTVAGQWDPFKSKNAPYNKWTPCLVFNINGKNPKPYECYYVKNQKHEQTDRAGGGISSGTAVWIRSISGQDKGDIIAVGDMGQPDDVRPTHFRFSQETINFPSRIFEVNEKPRLIKNQPKQIQDYYKKPEYKDIILDGDMTYDIVQKLRIKDGGRFIKIKRIPEIIKTNIRRFKDSVQ